MEVEQTLTHIRLNLAFERMVVAVLGGAITSMMAALLLHSSIVLIEGVFSAAQLVTVFMKAIYFGFVVFLTGFLSSACFGLPLFGFLERREARMIWPYLLLALIVQFVVASMALGHVLSIDDFSSIGTFLLLIPAPIIIGIFLKEIRPLWQSAKTAHEDQVKKFTLIQ